MLILDYFPVPLDTPLREFLQKLIRKEDSNFPLGHPVCIQLFPLLVAGGCDFYDVLSLYSEIKQLTEPELETLVTLSPTPVASLPVTEKDVRECIPRWTASKYSSGKITEAVDSIIENLTNCAPGVKIYDSNLNPRNKRSVNDRYVLIISGSSSLFYDINRRHTYLFQRNGEVQEK